MALDFFAGCVGGCAGVVVGHPFDTIKVKIQTQNFTKTQYKGAFDCFTKVVKNESVSALYKGMSSPMAGVAAVNAIVFGVYGNIQRRLPDPNSLTSHFVAGMTAGLLQSFICSPMEMVKTRMQIQSNNLYKSPMQCLSHIYKSEGYRGVFRGLNITLLREGPGFGSYFVCYELLTRNESSESISTPHMLLAGGTAGAVSWLLAYPTDVIKSRVQVDGMTGPRLYKNSLDCLVKSVKAEGISCLFRGLTPTLIRAFPTNAATWAAVTWIFRLANANQLQKDCYETLSEMVERIKIENIIQSNVVTLPNYGSFFKSHSLYLTNNELFTEKYFVKTVQADSRIEKLKSGAKEENVEKEIQETEPENETRDSENDDCAEKNGGECRPESIRLQEDETMKSKVYKCGKKMSLETFFVSLCKITTKSFS